MVYAVFVITRYSKNLLSINKIKNTSFFLGTATLDGALSSVVGFGFAKPLDFGGAKLEAFFTWNAPLSKGNEICAYSEPV